ATTTGGRTVAASAVDARCAPGTAGVILAVEVDAARRMPGTVTGSATTATTGAWRGQRGTPSDRCRRCASAAAGVGAACGVGAATATATGTAYHHVNRGRAGRDIDSEGARGGDRNELRATSGALGLKLLSQSLSLRRKLSQSCCQLRKIRRGNGP